MASAADSTSTQLLLDGGGGGGGGGGSSVPQWKRELIQRRRQAKLLATATSISCGLARGGASSTVHQADSTASPQFRAQQQLTPAGDAPVAAAGVTGAAMRLDQADMTAGGGGGGADSDSSEELQYGPGIVHKLRSKYLNLTLREASRSRPSVQRFRRAASLEDLLDSPDDPGKKPLYAKRPQLALPASAAQPPAKQDRYRAAARGNDSIKRARSVEALVRYNSAPGSVERGDPENEIILVDRASLKIESRLGKGAGDKPLHKPRRIRPVLADTERPPPDLVKTTLRLFESSNLKKLKPKGEVALKVATFKTINDTYKAQKKVIPKPPLQPKPFLNGAAKPNTSSRKIVLTCKPTAELIDRQTCHDSIYNNDRVITEPIVQSVSSVVSKFQQISCSPSSSPEPSFNKIRFSPISSPEPTAAKSKVSHFDIKSPTLTPVPSPRTSPPKAQSPLSPRTETVKSPCSFIQKPILNSTPVPGKIEQSKFVMSPDVVPNLDFEQDTEQPTEQVKESTIELHQSTEVSASKLNDTLTSVGSSTVIIDSSFDESVEAVDSPRTVSKSALDNISKAGMTVQFSFSDSPFAKSYLPRSTSSSQQCIDKSFESEVACAKSPEANSKFFSLENQSVSVSSDIIPTTPESPNFQDRLQAESNIDEIIYKEESVSVVENKPIGAISSLSLIKSTTTTTYPQGNESKTIRSPKSESNSPPQKQIGIIRPLVSTKTQLPQQNLSNREIEKNLINRVKSIEQPTKVVVSLKSAEEIQPVKKNNSSGGLWDSKPWNQQNNTMVFNFSNRKDVPDYIENDGLIIKRKFKPRSGDGGGVTVSSNESQLTDESDTELSVDPPSPCDVAFCNDNILINGRSNLSRTPRNHKHRIQFDDTATRTFEYPSEASMMLEAAAAAAAEGSSVDGLETSASGEAAGAAAATRSTSSGTLPSLLGGGGLASYTPSKVDLTSEGFELGISTRATISTLASPQSTTPPQQAMSPEEVDYLKPSQDPGTWGQETAADMLY